MLNKWWCSRDCKLFIIINVLTFFLPPQLELHFLGFLASRCHDVIEFKQTECWAEMTDTTTRSSLLKTYFTFFHTLFSRLAGMEMAHRIMLKHIFKKTEKPPLFWAPEWLCRRGFPHPTIYNSVVMWAISKLVLCLKHYKFWINF